MAAFFTSPAGTVLTLPSSVQTVLDYWAMPATNITVLAGQEFHPFAGWSYANPGSGYGYLALTFNRYVSVFSLANYGTAVGTNEIPDAVTTGPVPAGAADTDGIAAAGYYARYTYGAGAATVTGLLDVGVTVSTDQDIGLFGGSGNYNGFVDIEAGWVARLHVDAVQSIFATTTSPLTHYEGNSGTRDFIFTVARSGDTSGTATLSWAVTGTGAHQANGADFLGGVLPSGTVSFGAGEAEATITIKVLGDNLAEFDEQFALTLSGAPADTAIGSLDASGVLTSTGTTVTATILDDDTTISIDDPIITEGDGGITVVTFTITRTGLLDGAASVDWQFVVDDFQSVDTTDFVDNLYRVTGFPEAPFQTVQFDAGSGMGTQTRTLSFAIQGDQLLEADEYLHIRLSNPSANVRLADGEDVGTATIVNDDKVGTVGYRGTLRGDGLANTLTNPNQINAYALFGGAGNDTISGYGYDNLVYGGTGDDSLYGGDGHGMVDGGTGNDDIRLHGYDDTAYGGTGRDTIRGSEGRAYIDSGRGDDAVLAYGNNNVIYGNFGNDSIAGGDHDNTIFGGAGNDTIATTDQRNLIYGDDTTWPVLPGQTYDDLIFGGDHDNTVHGGYGNDTIGFIGPRNLAYGEDGNDSIDGGSGYATIYGGAGDDVITLAGWVNMVDGGDDVDTVILPGKRGDAQFLYAGGSWFIKNSYNGGTTQLTNVEWLRFAGDVGEVDIAIGNPAGGAFMQGDRTGHTDIAGLGGNDRLVGFGYGNRIWGNGGNDVIRGGEGNASLFGGDGNDDIAVGGNSNYIEAGGDNDLVTLVAHNNTVYGGGGNDLILAGIDSNFVDGGDGNDDIAVSGHNNTLMGGGGDDVFRLGLAGSDSVDGGDGLDVVYYSGNAAQFSIFRNPDGSVTLVSPGGNDLLRNVEEVRFADGIFRPTAPVHGDTNGDFRSDIVIQDAGGVIGLGRANGAGAASWITLGPSASQATLLADFDGDGSSDLLLQDTGTGTITLWQLTGAGLGTTASFNPGSYGTLAGAGDFDGDGRTDLAFQAADLTMTLLKGNGIAAPGPTSFGNAMAGGGYDWLLEGIGDINGDGRSDLVFHDAGTGFVYAWQMTGFANPGGANMGVVGTIGAQWTLVGTGDTNLDGKDDLLWQDPTDGALQLWLMDGLAGPSAISLGATGAAWHAVALKDLNGDGRSDIVFQHDGGAIYAWLMNGASVISGGQIAQAPGWDLV